jgi:16S rRNA G966 N2-methylase RsmD
MLRVTELPADIEVKRSDPVYMAHAYLTKVPVPAITPFIEAFTDPGDVVVDPFAGSGMTGVAAVMAGRSARLFDVSVLGQHIGSGYLTPADSSLVREFATKVVTETYARLGGVYEATCQKCGNAAPLSKCVWSFVVECQSCSKPVNFYRSLEAAEWRKDRMACPHCSESVTSKAKRIGDEPCVDFLDCPCSRAQVEQDRSEPLAPASLDGLSYPDVPIEPTRQMYVASALGRHGLTSTAKFFSDRNLMALATLRDEIDNVPDDAVRRKLLFAFTAILTRASKRYQWSHARPLNAANANYYVAPVFYEWNVLDLFDRKVDAIIKADKWIESGRRLGELTGQGSPEASYEIGSAVSLPVADASVDYVFTDPPFGSNIFYADMNLFHEAWLGQTTSLADEAVVDRSNTDDALFRTADRYERMLTQALSECRRVLKPDGYLSMVFGNSSGAVWSLVQRAVAAAGLRILPDIIATLDKGQRSVKGLASGFENVVTVDLVLTMQPDETASTEQRRRPDHEEVRRAVSQLAPSIDTPSHLYVSLLRHGLREGWDLGAVDLKDVTRALLDDGFEVDSKRGRLVRSAQVS